MAISITVLFGKPQQEIASLIEARLAGAVSTSIITGFATPGGLELISDQLLKRPMSIKAFVVGAATYPAFEVLDSLLAAGVTAGVVYVHNGHTFRRTGKNPFARYHPMMHSKVFFMEMPGDQACAFVGSDNITAFALDGLNGEASILLEGNADAPEFHEIRSHISSVVAQSQVYSPGLKEAYAWWLRQYLDSLKAEIASPSDWRSGRIIIIIAQIQNVPTLRIGDAIFFEMPAGIEQIRALDTEVHLFLFSSRPATPWEALGRAGVADASYVCITQGADNERGMIEVDAQWRIDSTATLVPVPGGQYRPSTAPGLQQVRATVRSENIPQLQYSFEDSQETWTPELSKVKKITSSQRPKKRKASLEIQGGERNSVEWRLVTGFSARERLEADQSALALAKPESGSFVLVSLKTRKKL